MIADSMLLLAAFNLWHFLLGGAMLLTSCFLILLVLVQKGRGGGLAGALGGMGGQSAFGTKAGDLFTRITVATAFVWIVLCIVSIQQLGGRPVSRGGGNLEDNQAAEGAEEEPVGPSVMGAGEDENGAESPPPSGTGDDLKLP